jgi:ubiquinone/menaquinone biosynthesis C-methylase UbiE
VADQEYAEASYEIWQRMAAGWDRQRVWMWEVSQSVGQWMVRALELQPGDTVLELAAGTGETGFAAAEAIGPQGRLIQTDFAPNMVAAARREAERLGLRNVEHRVLDAQRMELASDDVDAVLCRWGYMLMADPAAALRETRRVLLPGGRLALSVWGEPDRNRWGSEPGRALAEYFDAPPPDPLAPGSFALADPERTRALVEGAGFEVRRMEEIELTYGFSDFDDYWRFVNQLAGGLALALGALSEDDRAAVRDLTETKLSDLRAPDGSYSMPGVTQNTLAA